MSSVQNPSETRAVERTFSASQQVKAQLTKQQPRTVAVIGFLAYWAMDGEGSMKELWSAYRYDDGSIDFLNMRETSSAWDVYDWQLAADELDVITAELYAWLASPVFGLMADTQWIEAIDSRDEGKAAMREHG